MYYKKSIKEVFDELNTNECGLSSQEVSIRLEKIGLNSLREEKGTPLIKIFLHQFADPLIYILIIAAFFTLIIREYINTAVIFAAVILNAVIGFFQEYKSEKAMQAIKKLVSPKAIAVRNSKEIIIDSTQIVPGDVVLITAGNKVPADVRLFEINELEIDESMFTGESVPVEKQTAIIYKENISIADQKNMAFMGTVVTQGTGKGIVVATGEKTELGEISKQVKSTEKEQTPLQNRLADFSRKIGILAVGLSVIVFIMGLFLGHSLIDMALFAISMSVAVIPEGLPVVITIAMAIGLKRMADRNAIIRKLIAVETLGSCNYICSDKTGTITENMMTVTKAYANDKEFKITGTGYKPEGKIIFNEKEIEEDEDVEILLFTGLLCNSAKLYEENENWKINGDPTEGALIVAAEKYGLNIEKAEFNYKFVDEIPFSSKRQYMATLYEKDNKCIIFVKGSPEKILNFSENNENKKLLNQYSQMADSGLRVLGFGIKNLDKCLEEIDLEYEATHDLTFVGFQGIIDPPRQSAIQAIKETKDAGIKTVMLTGDHKITAVAIARQTGIFKQNDLAVTGSDLDSKGVEYLRDCAEQITVYARVSPEHKFKIVEALQDKGNIVAVTGDGVNDAPALKKGNIGVSMGQVGTDVAREASDVVLKDDNFATIFEAVREGRIIYENIQKVIFFLLGSGFGIAATIILTLLFGLPLPFLATQVLWINLVSNGLQDVALAYEPGEKGIAKRPPRNPKEGIINKFILKRLTIVGAVITIGTLFVYWYKLSQGMPVEYARTAAFNTVVFYQFFHVLNSRSFDESVFKMNPFTNPLLLVSLILALFAQIAVITISPLQFLFSTTPLNAITWIQTILIGSTIIIVIEIDKAYRKKHSRVS